MSVAARSHADPADPAATASSDPPVPRRPWRTHVLVAALAVALATFLLNGLWLDPFNRVLLNNIGDQAFFEWALGYGVYVVEHGANPFYSTMMNVPHGVNLAANTSITVYAVLLYPVTKLAGPQVSFVTVLTLNLAGSAFAWYLFLGRWLVRNRLAAAVGGFFCGFAPGFVAHANGHLNWTSGWIGPVIIWWLLKLREPGRWLRNGVVLALLVVIAFSVAAEGLFFTAFAGAVFLLVWSAARATRGEARAALPTVLAGLAVAGVVTGALLAYPLYLHFAGAQTFAGTGFNQSFYAEDAMAFLSYSDRTLAAFAGLHNQLSPNRTEETSFFGLPLLLLIIAALVLLWRRSTPGRRATLRALLVVALVFLVLSLGPQLIVLRVHTGFGMPYQVLKHLPLFDSALPARFALILVGVFGIVLALTAEQLLDRQALSHRTRVRFAIWYAVALVPILPTPILHTQRAPEPAFIANRTWEKYVPPGGVLSALPFALNVTADGQRWQAYTMARGGRQFRIPGGYFLGPDVTGKNGPGRIGAVPRATDALFQRAAVRGYRAVIDNRTRARARADFQYWGINALMLPAEVTADKPVNRAVLLETAIQLLGPPQQVDDVLLWQIRPGVDPVDQ